MSANLLKDYARKYYGFGWNIIPLFDYSKNPATGNQFLPYYWQNPETRENSMIEKEGWDQKQGWWPLSQRRQEVDEIKTWIDNESLTGLGVITGEISGITVVDEDSYKEGGKKFELATPLISASVNGGFHHYFKFNPDVGTTGLRKNVFVEIKSEGGFIVLPPSQVKNKQGKIGKYSWFKQKIKSIDDLPTVDQSALADLAPEQTELKQTVLSDLTKVEFGEQHTSLRQMANVMLFKHNPADWEQFVYPIIREKASNYVPAHPPWRVERMIKDCSDFVLRKKSEKTHPQSIGQVVQKRLAEKELEKDCPGTGYRHLDAILKGFIPGHVYCLSGLTNVGKTSAACNFAVRVAAQDKRVLYFSLEPDNNIVDYLASASSGREFSELTPQDLADINRNIEIYTKDQISTLTDMISVLHKLPRYDLIVIDHLGYFIQGDSQGGTFQEQENTLKKLVTLAQKQQSAVMFIVHMRKKAGGYKKKKKAGQKTAPGIDELKGASALSQDSTDVIFVTREVEEDGFTQTDEGRMIVVKTKSGKNGAMEICFVPDSARINSPEEMERSMF